MLNVGIIGATGYTGEELIRLLLNHPKVNISYLAAKNDKPFRIDEVFPQFKGKISLSCENLDMNKAKRLCDLLFLALPHTVSMNFAGGFLKKGKRVIDLSADYRFKHPGLYRQWYKAAHKDSKNLAKAVYGLPEINLSLIKKADLIANPGCYPTAAILAIAPLILHKIIDVNSIIIDAKSGLTGAGRKASADYFFSEINENFKAYRINRHQHMPEITEQLSNLAKDKVNITFVPHLLPLNRGILETIYLKLKKNISFKGVRKIYSKFFNKSAFVKILDRPASPEIKDVLRTNICQIGFRKDKNSLICVVAIDNLGKGASGQAVQNMNIMYGFSETEGLI